MNSVDTAPEVQEYRSGGVALTGLRWWLTDVWLLAGRNIRRTVRMPDLIFTLTVMPLVFFVFFGYIIGGAMQVPGGNYIRYLYPGLMIGMITYGALPAMVAGLGEDMRNGIMDRFRSLPMTRSSVLIGRAFSEGARHLVGVLVLIAVGLIAGYRFREFGLMVAGIALVLLYGFSLAWIASFVALTTRSVEAAQMIATVALAPLGFISSMYAPPETMPVWARLIAQHNPITHVVDTVRAWFNGASAGSSAWLAFAWLIGITLVFGTLAVVRFQRATS